jgi:hypothetical protein
MKKAAILYICTDAYVAFWEDFFRSFEENFLPATHKEYFVFTDASCIYGENDQERVHRISQENLGWPGNTLFRFRMFRRIENELTKFDYIFFMNANIICAQTVTEQEFLPSEEQLLVVRHPGYYADLPYVYAYERRKASLAYIPYWKGKVYVCGGVNGGKADAFLKLVKELDERIDKDYQNGIIAAWHDESHINRYILERDDYRLLSPAYCYPEGWDLPFEKKLVVLDKEKKIQLDRRKVFRQKEKPAMATRVRKKATMIFWSVVYRFKG